MQPFITFSSQGTSHSSLLLLPWDPLSVIPVLHCLFWYLELHSQCQKPSQSGLTSGFTEQLTSSIFTREIITCFLFLYFTLAWEPRLSSATGDKSRKLSDRRQPLKQSYTRVCVCLCVRDSEENSLIVISICLPKLKKKVNVQVLRWRIKIAVDQK